MSLLMTAQEASELLGAGITAQELRDKANEGAIPFHRRPGRSRGVYFTQSDIDWIINDSAVVPSAVEELDRLKPTARSEKRNESKNRKGALSA